MALLFSAVGRANVPYWGDEGSLSPPEQIEGPGITFSSWDFRHGWGSDVPRTVDLSTFTEQNLRGLDLCYRDYAPTTVTSGGQRIKMLGAAIVYVSPGNGQAVMGHLGERFIYCRNDELFDVYYDYAPLGKDRLRGEFAKKHEVDLSTFPQDVVASYENALYVDLIIDPAGVYGREQFYGNRTIFEAWFKLDDMTMYKMMAANARRYKEQKKVIQARQKLPEYRLFKNNCMTPLKEDLAIVNPEYLAKYDIARLTPTFLFHSVEKRDVERIVVYPSQRMYRLLKKKERGESTLFENIVPLSDASDGNANGAWMLLFPEGKSAWTYFLLSPLAGAANFVTAAAETAYGVLTIPMNWLGMVPGLKWLHSPSRGVNRAYTGLRDMAASLGEVVWLRSRYPRATQWTDEEREFFQSFTQNAALIEFLQAKHSTAPVMIDATTALGR